MAKRAVPLTAAAVAGALVALTLGPILILTLRAQGWPGGADMAALRFTLVQAILSAAISVGLAVPVARALARRRFPGRGAMIAMMGAPFLLPAIVSVMAILSVFGRSGWLAQAGVPLPSVYGLHGVVLAHVFLNLPLAVRMILLGWQGIPVSRIRLAQSLGFDAAATWRHLEMPMLRDVVPGVLVVVFLLCMTSFAVALTLGGGPRATTLELAIYQALRFEFDLPRAAMLAGMQIAISGLAVAVAVRLVVPAGFGAGDAGDGPAALAPAGWRRGVHAAWLVAAALFLFVPLLSVILHGLAGLPDLPAQAGPAALRSASIAVAASLLAVGGALALALATARGWRLFEVVTMLPMAVSSLVLGTGLFLAVRIFVAPSLVALPVTVLVNAALALPFAFRIVLPDVRAVVEAYARLSASLGLTGPRRLVRVTLPLLRRPLGFALGLSAALAAGDLGVIALFAGDAGETLPLLVARLAGAYRTDAAAAAALVLVALAFGLFVLFDRIVGGRVVAERTTDAGA